METSGEGFGQDLDPLASFQSGWATSGMCWFSPLYLGWLGARCVQGSSIFLWLWVPLAFEVLAVVAVGLGRASWTLVCFTEVIPLRNPGWAALREPLGRWRGEACE